VKHIVRSPNKFANQPGVDHGTLDDFEGIGSGRKIVSKPREEIVEDTDSRANPEEPDDRIGSDKSGSASYQDSLSG
jgi:hypothetical protein